MRPPAQCIHSSRKALCRVLVSPIERTRLLLSVVPAATLTTTTTTTTTTRRSRTTMLLPQPPLSRGYAKKPSSPPARGPRGPTSAAAKEQVARDERGFDKRYTTQRDIERSGRDRPPQDHEITDPQIMVVDKGAAAAAAAEGPLGTQFVLTRLEPHESLRMTQPYVPADADNGRPSPQFAVCKIVDKREEYERRKQVRGEGKGKGKAAAARPRTKELELTWAIGEHDLATKMRQMGGFLAKGLRVEVLVARKKGGRQVDGKEAEGVVKRIRDEVERSAGREAKPATGQAGGTMRFYLEGKPAK